MLNPFVSLLDNIISIYIFILLVYIVMNWLIAFNVINKYQPFILRLNLILAKLTEPVLSRIRRFLPDMGGIDLSPIVLILILYFIRDALYSWFWSI